MLLGWKFGNFKSVAATTHVELGGLTVLAGANSSGKSTLLHSILLAQQTMRNPVAARALVLNGHVLRLGGYDDIVNKSTSSDELCLGFSYSLEDSDHPTYGPRIYRGEDSIEVISGEFVFVGDETEGQPADLPTLQALLKSAHISMRTRAGSSVDVTIHRSEKSADERARSLGLSPASLRDEERQLLTYEVSGQAVSSWGAGFFDGEGEVVGVRLTHFLPTSTAIVYDIVQKRASILVDYVINQSNRVDSRTDDVLPPAFIERVCKILEKFFTDENVNSWRSKEAERYIAEIRDGKSLAPIRHLHRMGGVPLRRYMRQHQDDLVGLARGGSPSQKALTQSYSPLGDLELQIRYLFTEKLRYLGPLRDEPRPYYPLEGAADPTDVGVRGEFTAAVLHLHKDREVSYVSSSSYIAGGPSAPTARTTLHKAVVDWLSYLGVITDLATEDRGVFGHELRVATDSDKPSHTLVHVGVGVSQVLPIVVMALIARPGSVLIFEQPELHLHPRVQARLGDFFLSVMGAKKQCIVETHSEYMINRLRLRCAEDVSDEVVGRLALYNVNKRDGLTCYERVRLNEFGSLEEWPDGFFDQSPREAESILMAAMKKREVRRGTK